MADEATPKPGTICHIEIPSDDLAKSAEFYSAVFGWQYKENAPTPDYWFFKAGDIGGAFAPDAKPSEEGVILVLAVEDIPAALKEIGKAGGAQLKGKTEIGGGMGYYAYFKDPCGNRLGLWSKV